jgi:hypothetical protein
MGAAAAAGRARLFPLSRHFWQTAPAREQQSCCLPQLFWGLLEPVLGGFIAYVAAWLPNVNFCLSIQLRKSGHEEH